MARCCMGKTSLRLNGTGDIWWQAEHCWRGLLRGCVLHQVVADWLPCAVCYRMSLMPSGSGGEVVWVL